MDNFLLTLQKKVSYLANASKIKKLNKGYSLDEKYIVFFHDRKYLLRISDLERYERKKAEFQILNKLCDLNVQSPKPIDLGINNELQICYSIYTFIEGNDGIEILDELNDHQQRKIGFDAGIQLSRIHLLKAPLSMGSWYERAMAKHYRYLEAYKHCDIKIHNDEKIIDFIERNKHWLKDRPNHFQHDDFHLGNIIVQDNKYAGVIDFDNFDWGDPIHDFVKVALFQRELSVPFSTGQIKGYFNEEVPETFWLLYSIYNAMVVFSSVVWSLRFTPDQVDEMIGRIYNILEDHKNFELVKPLWFK